MRWLWRECRMLVAQQLLLFAWWVAPPGHPEREIMAQCFRTWTAEMRAYLSEKKRGP